MNIIIKMRNLVCLCLLLTVFQARSALAYLEETHDDSMTSLTAGEHTTNMYKMSAQGKINLKKLKEIDELMTKSPKAGDGSAENVAEVTRIVNERNDAAVRAAAEQARQTAKLLENKTELKQKSNGQVAQTIIAAATTQARDADVAMKLMQTLQRRKP